MSHRCILEGSSFDNKHQQRPLWFVCPCLKRNLSTKSVAFTLVDRMSPIKRAFQEKGDELIAKRIRGGGDDDDDVDAPMIEEELFDDELDEPTSQGTADSYEDMEAQIPAEVLKASLDEQQTKRWSRPAVAIDGNKSDLHLQWMDMDVVSGAPLKKNPNESKSSIVGRDDGQVPILRTFGVTEEGNSVTLFIHGFTPYCYFALPQGYKVVDPSSFGEARQLLQTRLQGAVRSSQSADAAVLGITHVTDHTSLMGFEAPHTEFLKVFVSLPGFVPALKRVMEGGIDIPGIEPSDDARQQYSESAAPVYSAFECNVPFVLRFMVDRGISGAGWLTLPAETYQVRPADKCETHCQVRLAETLSRL